MPEPTPNHNKSEAAQREQEVRSLLSDYQAIINHTQQSGPMNSDQISLIGIETARLVYDTVSADGIAIITGPSGIGKSTLAMQTSNLSENRGILITAEDNIHDADSFFEKVSKAGKLHVSTLGAVCTVLREERRILAIDELNIVRPNRSKPQYASLYGEMIDYLRGEGVPLILIMHETGEEIEQYWPSLANVRRISPDLLTPEELTTVTKHGAIYKKGEPIYQPVVYKGATPDAIRLMYTMLSRRPIFVLQTVNELLNLKIDDARYTRYLDREEIMLQLKSKLGNVITSGNFGALLGKEIVRNLRSIGGLKEVVTAFNLDNWRIDYSDFDPDILKAKKDAISDRTTKLLLALRTIQDAGDKWELDGIQIASGISTALKMI